MSYKQKKYKQMIDTGMCVFQCGKPKSDTHRFCEPCRLKNNASQVRLRKERLAVGLCVCGEPVTPTMASCEKCRKANLDYRHKFRREVLAIYGGKCVCCGETEESFLAFDHINGGGNAERKIRKGGDAQLRWLKKNNYPKTMQILCHNCNWAKHARGVCPHQSNK